MCLGQGPGVRRRPHLHLWISSPSGVSRDREHGSLPNCCCDCSSPHPQVLSHSENPPASRGPSPGLLRMAADISQGWEHHRSRGESLNPQRAAGVSKDKVQSQMTFPSEALGHSGHSPGPCSFCRQYNKKYGSFWHGFLIHVHCEQQWLWLRQIQDRKWFDLLTSRWLSGIQSKGGTLWSPGSCSFSICTMQLRRSQTRAWEKAKRLHKTSHCCWLAQAVIRWWERRATKGQAGCKIEETLWIFLICNTIVLHTYDNPTCVNSILQFTKHLFSTHTNTHKAYEIEQKIWAPFHRWGNLNSGKLKLHAQGLPANEDPRLKRKISESKWGFFFSVIREVRMRNPNGLMFDSLISQFLW